MIYFWLILLIALLLFIAFRRPKQNRAWCPEHSKTARVEIKGDDVKIYNFVRAKYKGPLDPEKVSHETFEFNLNQLKGLAILLEEFPVKIGEFTFTPAHLFLSFELDDGRVFSISVAGRRLRNEKITFKRILPHYKEIFYKVIDEKDTIVERAYFEKDPIFVFPLEASKEQIKKVFLDMAKKINKLDKRPEWFDTFSKNCTSEAVRHLRRAGFPFPKFSLRYIFTNSFEKLLFEKGFLEVKDESQIRNIYDLTEFIIKHKDDKNLSVKLRAELNSRIAKLR